ncbi:HAD-IIB family hydrolase [Arcobacter sp.]|uniref:HAD-IIB family hydrolase n=1 Tax=unclassified Arcobacter TaxID=2593671 RepID=UPI003B00E2D3
MLQKDTKTDYLIFTDLDGTLLDHKTYEFNEAKEMLDFIREQKIPLIIVTSKTKDEVVELQKKLDISFPFVIENGAGIFIPKEKTYELISLGKNYDTTISAFKEYSKKFPIQGFHEMNDEEVSLYTGLPKNKAKKARKRTFSEPFILKDETKAKQLKQLVLTDGFDVVKGGRFYHLITFGQDKAKAVLEMKKYYDNLYNKNFKTIALGDGENDITMLKCVDIPILIKKYDGSFIKCEINNLTKSRFIGPKGWNNSLKRILNVK